MTSRRQDVTSQCHPTTASHQRAAPSSVTVGESQLLRIREQLRHHSAAEVVLPRFPPARVHELAIQLKEELAITSCGEEEGRPLLRKDVVRPE